MPEVTIFTRTTCAPCKTVKYFLGKRGVVFKEKNIDEPENQAEFNRIAEYPMVPLILVGEQKLQGLNLTRLSEMLMV